MPALTQEQASVLEHHARLISQIENLEHGQALFARIRVWMQELRDDLENRPRVDNENISRDFRVQLGQLKAFRRVLEEPNKCQEQLETMQF